MKINGRVHCLFEQSGTFKREFIKLGIPAEDYDIQNNFGQTEHCADLFAEIENAYRGGVSVFDGFTKDDLILAFFPCIYFSAMSQLNMSYNSANYKKMNWREKTDAILERSKNRERFFSLAVMMLSVCHIRGLRIIMENPWNEQTFLKGNFVATPTIVDYNRMKRGDYFVKPTAYWFVNCEPTNGFTLQYDKKAFKKTHDSTRGSKVAGLCSEERSMISPDYARNFISDFILGSSQSKQAQQCDLFD